jgi:hypothetical protein
MHYRVDIYNHETFKYPIDRFSTRSDIDAWITQCYPGIIIDVTSELLILPGDSFLVAGRPAFVILTPIEKRQTPQP